STFCAFIHHFVPFPSTFPRYHVPLPTFSFFFTLQVLPLCPTRRSSDLSCLPPQAIRVPLPFPLILFFSNVLLISVCFSAFTSDALIQPKLFVAFAFKLI